MYRDTAFAIEARDLMRIQIEGSRFEGFPREQMRIAPPTDALTGLAAVGHDGAEHASADYRHEHQGRPETYGAEPSTRPQPERGATPIR